MLVVLVLLLAGCGDSAPSIGQLRPRAARICERAEVATAALTTPSSGAQSERFLSGGVAALTPELAALTRLRTPDDAHQDWRTAIRATQQELDALRSAANGLRAGDDPVVEIETLQHRLAPIELRAGPAWSALRIPACAAQ